MLILVAKKLSSYMKTQFYPKVLHRDGPNCFYCHIPFINIIKAKLTGQEELIREWDHLNNNEEDNRLENLVFAHRKCNREKKRNLEFEKMARNKLHENERSAEIPDFHANTDKETNTETDTNGIFTKIAKEYLEDMLIPHNDHPPIEEKLIVKHTCDILAGRGIKKTGHGSPVTFRRIIDVFCAGEFAFEKYKEDGVWFIRLRYDEMME